jgi:hypothetical protein
MAAATRLAREVGHPVRVGTGLPLLTPQGRGTSLAVDAAAVGWEPLGTTLVVPPTGPAEPTGPVSGLDGYPALEEYVFRLTEHWVAEVTQSGLWVRPTRQVTGARVVRAHRWVFGKVRIFVGLPGQLPGHEVLPVLGALLARLPADTRRRVELSPARFAVAAQDGARDPGAAPPAVQRSVVLRPVPDPAPRPLPAGAATPEPRPDGEPVRLPAAPRPQPKASGSPTGRPQPVRLDSGRTRPLRAVPTGPPPVAPTPVRAPVPAPEPGPAATTPLPVLGPAAHPTAAEPDRAARPPAVAPRPAPPAQAETGLLGTGERPLPRGHRKPSRRRATPVLAAAAVLAVATASGYALNLTSFRPPEDPPANQAEQPPGEVADPELPPPPAVLPDPANPSPEPSGSAGPEPTLPASVTLGSSGSPAPSFPIPGAPAPPSPAGSPPPSPARTSEPPRPAPSSAAPGRVNSTGRNLALGGAASASSVEVAGVWDPRYAVDGNPESRWASSFTGDPQWLSVDLGELWRISEVRVVWERAYATAWRLEVSSDGRTWRTVHRTGNGYGGAERISFAPTPARYVRVVGTAKVMQGYGYSIHEVEIR